ncbi:MAG: hypothetical protein H6825_16845 [Planctomycetes bacterium]|nr:hypothetical protein [Planctomycetota bacterium]
MKSRFDFQDVHKKTGVLLLVTFSVLVLALLGAAGAQRWFVPVYRLEVGLGEEGAVGLSEGAEVKMLGTVIGRVERIELVEDQDLETGEGRLNAMASLVLRDGDMLKFVRRDSEVKVMPKGVLEPGFLEITRGRASGTELFSGEVRAAVWGQKVTIEDDLQEQALSLLSELQEKSKQILEGAREEGALAFLLGEEYYGGGRELLRRLDVLLGRFEDKGAVDLLLDEQGSRDVLAILDAAAKLLQRLQAEGALPLALGPERTARLDEQGPVGWALGDPGLSAELGRLLTAGADLAERLEQRGILEVALSDPAADPERTARVVDDLERLLQNVRWVSDELAPLAVSLSDEAVRLPGVVAESQETLRQVEILVRAIQQHWLLRSYVDPRPAEGRIPVDQLPLEGGR